MSALKKLRIAFVIDSLGNGGAERALLNMVPDLNKFDVDPIVIPLFPDNSLDDEYQKAGIKVVRLTFGHKWSLFKNSRLLAKYIRGEKIDLVHAHLFFSGIYVGLSKYKNPLIPRVLSFHNLAYAKGCNPRNASYFLRKVINRFVVKYNFSRLIAVSSAVAEHYAQNLGVKQKKIEVIGNGLPVEQFSAHRVRAANKNHEYKKIVAVGRLVPEKGYEYLLHAFARIQKKYSGQLYLQILGSGPLEQQLKDLSRNLGIDGHIEFTGTVPHERVLHELLAADIYVLSSVFEGFGLSVAEAILMEIPVVVTSVGGVMDVVRPKFARIVAPGDADAIVNGLEEVLDYDEARRQKVVRSAKEFVVNEYSSRKVAGKLFDLYRQELKSLG